MLETKFAEDNLKILLMDLAILVILLSFYVSIGQQYRDCQLSKKSMLSAKVMTLLDLSYWRRFLFSC